MTHLKDLNDQLIIKTLRREVKSFQLHWKNHWRISYVPNHQIWWNYIHVIGTSMSFSF